MRINRGHVLLVTVLFLIALPGCGKKKEDKKAPESKTESKTETKPEGRPEARPAREKAPEKKPELVSHDLSSVGAEWKGWSAKVPKGKCKVMKDMGKWARIGCDGPGISDSSGRNGIDVRFTQKQIDLAKFKAKEQKLWKKRAGKATYKILADKPDLFAWKSTVGKANAFHFVMNREVAGVKVSCSTNFMVGGGTEEEHNAHLEACKSLTKGGAAEGAPARPAGDKKPAAPPRKDAKKK